MKNSKVGNKKLTRLHVMVRTSPKGPGQECISTCINCGKEGLRWKDRNEYCENVTGRTSGEGLIAAIKGGD